MFHHLLNQSRIKLLRRLYSHPAKKSHQVSKHVAHRSPSCYVISDIETYRVHGI